MTFYTSKWLPNRSQYKQIKHISRLGRKEIHTQTWTYWNLEPIKNHLLYCVSPLTWHEPQNQNLLSAQEPTRHTLSTTYHWTSLLCTHDSPLCSQAAYHLVTWHDQGCLVWPCPVFQSLDTHCESYYTILTLTIWRYPWFRQQRLRGVVKCMVNFSRAKYSDSLASGLFVPLK